MQYDIRYTSFNGNAGVDRLDSLEILPAWLRERPGTHIVGIQPLAMSAEAQCLDATCREKALARFAESILDSLQNYRGE